MEDLSEELSACSRSGMAPAQTSQGLCYPDPRLLEAGTALPSLLPSRAGEAAAEIDARARFACTRYEAASHRARPAARRPRFRVWRVLFRTRPTWTSSAASISTRAASSARRWSRVSSIAAPPAPAVVPVTFEGARSGARYPGRRPARRSVGTFGSAAAGRGLAMLRLDRVAEALAAGQLAGRGRSRAASARNRPGHGMPSRALQRPANERSPPPLRRSSPLPMAEG